MQIVIDMDNEDYKRIQNIPNVFDSLTSRTYLAIRNGTPLPKKHGRLIDADELESRMKIGYCIVKNAPTIIEADKTESEDKE